MTGLFDDSPHDEVLSRIVQREIQKAVRGAMPPGNGKNGFWRTLAIIGTIVSAAFTAGMNWHRIDALTERFDTQVTQNSHEHDAFANKAVVDEHFHNVQGQLEDLKRLLTSGDYPPGHRR